MNFWDSFQLSCPYSLLIIPFQFEEEMMKWHPEKMSSKKKENDVNTETYGTFYVPTEFLYIRSGIASFTSLDT